MALQIWDFWFCLFFVYFNECHRGAADSSWSRLKKQNIIFFSLKFHLHCICSVTLHEELSFRNEETTLPKEGKADNGLRLGMIKHLPLKKIKLCNKTFPNISYTSTHISVPSNRRALALNVRGYFTSCSCHYVISLLIWHEEIGASGDGILPLYRAAVERSCITLMLQ